MNAADKQRLESLFAKHQAQILAFAIRRTGNLADAEEVAAETFVVAWRRLQQLPEPALPWLYGVARRLIANQRRGARRATRMQDKLIQESQVSSSGSKMGIDDQLLEALSRLKIQDRDLLQLVAWEELSHDEIAVVMGISSNAVAIRLHRARLRLNQELSDSVVKDSALMRTLRWYKGRSASRQREARP